MTEKTSHDIYLCPYSCFYHDEQGQITEEELDLLKKREIADV